MKFSDLDATARGDEIASMMRDYYDAARPLTFVERLFGKRSTASECADNLMLGLQNVVIEALQEDGRYPAKEENEHENC